MGDGDGGFDSLRLVGWLVIQKLTTGDKELVGWMLVVLVVAKDDVERQLTAAMTDWDDGAGDDICRFDMCSENAIIRRTEKLQ